MVCTTVFLSGRPLLQQTGGKAVPSSTEWAKRRLLVNVVAGLSKTLLTAVLTAVSIGALKSLLTGASTSGLVDVALFKEER